MNDITIRGLDDKTAKRLKQLAWRNGLPLEELLRRLLVDTAVIGHAEPRSGDTIKRQNRIGRVDRAAVLPSPSSAVDYH